MTPCPYGHQAPRALRFADRPGSATQCESKVRVERVVRRLAVAVSSSAVMRAVLHALTPIWSRCLSTSPRRAIFDCAPTTGSRVLVGLLPVAHSVASPRRPSRSSLAGDNSAVGRRPPCLSIRTRSRASYRLSGADMSPRSLGRSLELDVQPRVRISFRFSSHPPALAPTLRASFLSLSHACPSSSPARQTSS